MARVDRQAVLAEYEAERLRCNNLLERPAGDMRRPTRVFETAQREADEDAALLGRTQRILIRDVSAADLGRYAALYADLVGGRPRTEADEVALIERTQRIRDWWADMEMGVTTWPPLGGQWDAVGYDGVMARDARELAEDMEWLEDARRSEVSYKKAVSRDSTIEEMWAKMEALGIMRD